MKKFQRFVATLLTIQFFLSAAMPYGAHAADPVPAPSPAAPAPKSEVDLGYLFRQSRVDYDEPVEISFDGEILEGPAGVETPLDKFRINAEGVVIRGGHELFYHYDAATRIFEFHKVKKRTARGYLISHSHIIHDVDMVSAPLTDGNFLHIATKEGLRSILIPTVIADFGIAPIFVPITSPAIPGKPIVEISYRNYGTLVDDLDESVTEFKADLDVFVKRHSQDESVVLAERLPYSDLVRNFAFQSAIYLQVLQVANPGEMDELAPVQRIFLRYTQRFQKSSLAIERDLFGENPGQGLVAHALSHPDLMSAFRQASLSSRAKKFYLKLFNGVKDGNDGFDRAASASNETVYLQGRDGAPSDYAVRNQVVLDARADAQKRGVPAGTWRSILAAHSEKVAQEKLIAMRAQASLDADQQKLHQDLQEALVQHGTPKRKYGLIAALTAGLGAIGYHYGVDNSFGPQLLSLVVAMADGASKVPLIGGFLGDVTAPMVKSLPALAGDSVFWKWTTGTILMGSLYWVSMWVTQLASMRSKENKTTYQRFFTFFTAFYGLVSYPLRKVILGAAFRQKNLYPGVDNGVPALTPDLWNSPFASNADIEDKAKGVAAKITDTERRSTEAMIIAAMIVSAKRESSEQPIDVVTLIQGALGHVDSEEKASTLLSAMSSPGFDQLTKVVAGILERTGDRGLQGKLDTSAVDDFTLVMENVASNIDAAVAVKEVHQATWRERLAARVRGVGRKMSPFFASWVMGVASLKVYRRYFENRGIEEKPADIAGHMFKHDFPSSTGLCAAADVSGFAAIMDFFLSGGKVGGGEMARALVMGSQQLVQYGAFSSIGPDGLDAIGADLPATQESLIATITKMRKAQKDKAALPAREQSMTEAAAGIWEGFTNPGETRVTSSHLNYIRNNFTGLKPRFLIDFAFRLPGMFFKAAQMKLVVSPLFLTGTAAAFSLNFFNVKFFYMWGAAGLAVGYAVVWPFIQLFMSYFKNIAASNGKFLEQVQSTLDNAIREGNVEATRDAIDVLQSLYVFGSTPLPESFQKVSEEFSEADAADFLAYSQAKMPVPVLGSDKLVFLLNIAIGAVVSASLATAAGLELFNMEHLDPLGALWAIVKFGVPTIVGLNLLNVPERGFAKWVQKLRAANESATVDGFKVEGTASRSAMAALCEKLANQHN